MSSADSVSWLVVTALGLEYNAVADRLSERRAVVHPQGSRYETGIWKGVAVAVAECGAGNTAAALECERALHFFRPAALVFVGIAGGLKDVALGDVVLASKIYAYESGKADKTFLTRPSMFTADYALLQTAKLLARSAEYDFRCFVGPIAAGEKVVSSVQSNEFAFIKEHYGDSLAVEMEGYGFLHAGYANAIPCLVVRGISDLIADKGVSDASGSQPIAADHASQMAFRLIDEQQTTATLPAVATADTTLEILAERLYPSGPNQDELWSRAGGNVALLKSGQNGRAAWFSALKMLEAGGGGSDISRGRLIETMLHDNPNNEALQRMRSDS